MQDRVLLVSVCSNTPLSYAFYFQYQSFVSLHMSEQIIVIRFTECSKIVNNVFSLLIIIEACQPKMQ